MSAAYRRHFAGGSAGHVPGGRAGVVARVHCPAAGVAQCRGVAGVVPDVPVLVPIAVGLGAGAVSGVDLDVTVCAEGVGQHQRLKAVIAVSWGFGAVLGMR